MARIFVTGSADGLGLMVGRLLVDQGHRVVLHARNGARAADARAALPGADDVVIGDLSTVAAMHDVADQANAHGRFDAVVHNVGIGSREPRRVATVDGLSQLWAVNVLAPYVLTVRMQRPSRLIYLSSGMHLGGDPGLDDPQWSGREWNAAQAYSDSKLHDVWLGFGIARRWPAVYSNVVDPDWVPTRMGGPDVPGDLEQAHLTQAWLATSDDAEAHGSGRLFHHRRGIDAHPAANDPQLQDRLLEYCAEVSGCAASDAGGEAPI